jgi:putative peptidoglycan lipid II flippase
MGLSFLSNVIIAEKFGSGKAVDVFFAAVSIPFLITNIFQGALSFAFIPAMTQNSLNDDRETNKTISSFINLGILLTGAFCTLGIIFAYPIMQKITPGFNHEKLVQAADMLRWLLPTIVLTTINESIAGMYYVKKKFLLPSILKAMTPIMIITFVFSFHNTLSTKSIVLAILISAIIQSLSFCFLSQINIFRYSFSFKFNHPGVLKIVTLMYPLLIGMIVYRGIPIFDQFLLSSFPEGNIAILNYSIMIVYAIPTLIVTGIATVIFPHFSDYFATNNMELFKIQLNEILRTLSLIVVPLIMFISIYPENIVRIIFERGSFTQEATLNVAGLLGILIITILPMTAGSILGQAFYSTHRTWLVAILGILETFFYIIISYFLTSKFGIYGLIGAKAIYWYLAYFVTLTALGKVLQWPPKIILSHLTKTIFAFFPSYILLNFLKISHVGFFTSGLIFSMTILLSTHLFSLTSDIKFIQKIYRWKRG